MHMCISEDDRVVLHIFLGMNMLGDVRLHIDVGVDYVGVSE